MSGRAGPLAALPASGSAMVPPYSNVTDASSEEPGAPASVVICTIGTPAVFCWLPSVPRRAVGAKNIRPPTDTRDRVVEIGVSRIPYGVTGSKFRPSYVRMISPPGARPGAQAAI